MTSPTERTAPASAAPAATASAEAHPARSRLVRGLVVYGLAVALICLGWEHPLPLTGLLIVLAAVHLLWARTRVHVASFLVGALLGPAAEVVCVTVGVWAYTGVELIPVWLPPAWGLACSCLLDIVGGLLATGRSPSGNDVV